VLHRECSPVHVYCEACFAQKRRTMDALNAANLGELLLARLRRLGVPLRLLIQQALFLVVARLAALLRLQGDNSITLLLLLRFHGAAW